VATVAVTGFGCEQGRKPLRDLSAPTWLDSHFNGTGLTLNQIRMDRQLEEATRQLLHAELEDKL
jgi:hypothetical protein